MGVVIVILDGVQYSAIQCAACDHRTPAGGTCLTCQPSPDIRCMTCHLRGPIPTTTTIAPGLSNDDPTTSIIVNPGGNAPPGANA